MPFTALCEVLLTLQHVCQYVLLLFTPSLHQGHQDKFLNAGCSLWLAHVWVAANGALTCYSYKPGRGGITDTVPTECCLSEKNKTCTDRARKLAVLQSKRGSSQHCTNYRLATVQHTSSRPGGEGQAATTRAGPCLPKPYKHQDYICPLAEN